MEARIQRVRDLAAAGHQIVIWSGGTAYAQRWCDVNDIHPLAALSKPDRLVDNQPRKWASLLGRRMLTPEQWMIDTEGGKT